MATTSSKLKTTTEQQPKVRLAVLETQVVESLTQQGVKADHKNLVALIHKAGTPTVDSGRLEFYTSERYGTRQDRGFPRWISSMVIERVQDRLRAVEVAADDAAEDEVVLVGEVLPLAQPGERLCDPRGHRDGSDLPRLRRCEVAVRVARADADGRAAEVDVPPAQRD